MKEERRSPLLFFRPILFSRESEREREGRERERERTDNSQQHLKKQTHAPLSPYRLLSTLVDVCLCALLARCFQPLSIVLQLCTLFFLFCFFHPQTKKKKNTWQSPVISISLLEEPAARSTKMPLSKHLFLYQRVSSLNAISKQTHNQNFCFFLFFFVKKN